MEAEISLFNSTAIRRGRGGFRCIVESELSVIQRVCRRENELESIRER